MQEDVAIKIQNLSKTYRLYAKPLDRLKEALHPLKKRYHKDFYALDNIDLEIKKGETVGIIGKNGSGKSTLLKVITGVTTPSSGRVTINGKVSAILELGAGFNPEMSGLENIYLNNSINGLSKTDTDNRIHEIIDFAELGDFIYQPIKTYSSGMKARLAFAVSINVNPDILIVDEALSVGDAAFQRKCFSKMEKIRKAGATILFVSHSEASIVSLCNRAVWLANGKNILEGEPKIVTSLYLKYVNSLNSITQIQNEHRKVSRERLQTSMSAGQKMDYIDVEMFDPNIKSKSMLHYDPDGLEIVDCFVTNMEEEKVNVLVHGRTYFYKYIIKSSFDNLLVRFGMGFKDLRGNVISGGVYPVKGKSVTIDKGIYTVGWRFRCVLNKGYYTTNCGVINPAEEISFLHRIVDPIMVKVVGVDSAYEKTGPVDMGLSFGLVKGGGNV